MASSIAVFGCLHGMLNDMYKTVMDYEKQKGTSIDFIIVCGDCQTIRHYDDLKCLAVPNKYKQMGDFHEYYSGKKQVPKLTIFVGGNHEASNYLMTMPYGGWVCHNFYYLGYAGVVNHRGLRIAGISGIYNAYNCNKGRFERMPLTDSSLRSIYHTRKIDVFRLQQLSKRATTENPIDIFLSHDWPARVYEHGDWKQLLRFKPLFRNDIESQEGLGNPLTKPLVAQLHPSRWFAAHLHCRFYAKIEHTQVSGEGCQRYTEFLSLNKIERGRRYAEFIEMSPPNDRIKNVDIEQEDKKSLGELEGSQPQADSISDGPTEEEIRREYVVIDQPVEADNNLYYDAEWLTILRKTADLENSSWQNSSSGDYEKSTDYVPSHEDIQETIDLMNKSGGMVIKPNFTMSEPVIYDRTDGSPASQDKNRCKYFPNPQHEELCSRLQLKGHFHEPSDGDGDTNLTRSAASEGFSNHNMRSRHNQSYRNTGNRNYHQDRRYNNHNSYSNSSSKRRGNPRQMPSERHYQTNEDPTFSGANTFGQPVKKRAFELDEDGCLPCYVDKKGES